MVQELPMKPWSFILPWVVSTARSGTVSPSVRPGISALISSFFFFFLLLLLFSFAVSLNLSSFLEVRESESE